MHEEDSDQETQEDPEDEVPSHEEVLDALRAFRDIDATAAEEGAAPTIGDVVTLVAAVDAYETPLVPDAVVEAVRARYQMHADVENGGLDQFVWNQGEEIASRVSDALRAVGAIESAEVIASLVRARVAFQKDHTAEEVTSDPVRFFLQFRKTVQGPFFPIPHHDEELAEALVEFILERPESLPDPERVVRKSQ